MTALPHLVRFQGVADGPLHDMLAATVLAMDRADHTRLRRLVSRSFSPRAADRHRAGMRAWSTPDLALLDFTAVDGCLSPAGSPPALGLTFREVHGHRGPTTAARPARAVVSVTPVELGRSRLRDPPARGSRRRQQGALGSHD